MIHLLNQIRQLSPGLYYCGMAHLFLFLLLLIISQVDRRQLLGINLWIKPMKFALSIGIYCLTWPLFLQYLPYANARDWFVTFTIAAMAFEMICIAGQAARGERSHFNIQGSYNTTVFVLMGLVITLQTLFALYIGILFFQVRPTQISASLLWGIRLGIIIACAFALEGGLMAARLSHSVGATDGGPGLPFLNWSRVAGDLRVGHFLGLHALQIIPLFAYFVSRQNTIGTMVFATVYFAFTSCLIYLALLRRPALRL
jgi:hypothetical protein